MAVSILAERRNVATTSTVAERRNVATASTAEAGPILIPANKVKTEAVGDWSPWKKMRIAQKQESARRAGAEVLAQAFSGSRSSSSTLTVAEIADHEAFKSRRRLIKQEAQEKMQTAQQSPTGADAEAQERMQRPKWSRCIKQEEMTPDRKLVAVTDPYM